MTLEAFPELPAEIKSVITQGNYLWWLSLRGWLLELSGGGSGGAGSGIPLPATTVVSETSFGQSPVVGTGIKYARDGHSHGTPAAPVVPAKATTVVSETAYGQSPVVGASGKWSDGDHSHGTPAAPVIPIAGDTVTNETTYGISPAAGSDPAFSRKDHTHGSPSAPVKTRYAPVSLTLNKGTYTAGNVASVATPFDGNTYDLHETAGAPGFDLDFTFSGVVKFNRINYKLLYDGTAAHHIQIQLYNYNTTAWDDVTVYSDMGGYFFWITVEGIPSANYISAGAAKVKIYHVSPGSTGHLTQIDYLSLVHDFDG